MMSDVDIRRALGKDIVVEPFIDRSLSPLGYDLRVGDFIYLLSEGPLSSSKLFPAGKLLQPVGDTYEVPPRATVQILSKEIVWVSRRIAGTLHSKVSLVSRGLSAISTTLDPGWFGPFLITMTNQSEQVVRLKTNDTFATLVFYRLVTPTRGPNVEQESLMSQQLEDQSAEYVAKMKVFFKDDLYLQFKKKVGDANRPVAEKIVESVRSEAWRNRLGRFLLEVPTLLAAVVVLIPTFSWTSVKGLFNDIGYDGSVLLAQVTAVGMLVSIRLSLGRRFGG